MPVDFLASGDSALVVEFGAVIDRAVSEQVLRLNGAVKRAALPGVIATVPTYRSLLVHYDPLQTTSATLTGQLEKLLAEPETSVAAGRRWLVPTCYEPEYAPDLDWVAEQTGKTGDEIIALHGAQAYHVYMIGFLPGFAYMGDLPDVLVLPRREDPRVRIPPGSVAIATSMTAIYPVESPGGWHLIGTTPIKLFDSAESPPALFAPGDQVAFQAVDEAEFLAVKQASEAGRYVVECQEIVP